MRQLAGNKAVAHVEALAHRVVFDGDRAVGGRVAEAATVTASQHRWVGRVGHRQLGGGQHGLADVGGDRGCGLGEAPVLALVVIGALTALMGLMRYARRGGRA